MIRFFIKDNSIVFALQVQEFQTEEDIIKTAQCISEYDMFIDMDTDNIMREYIDGKLQQQETMVV